MTEEEIQIAADDATELLKRILISIVSEDKVRLFFENDKTRLKDIGICEAICDEIIDINLSKANEFACVISTDTLPKFVSSLIRDMKECA